VRKVAEVIVFSVVPILFFGAPVFLLLLLTATQRVDRILSRVIRNTRLRGLTCTLALLIIAFAFALFMLWSVNESHSPGDPPTSKYQAKVYGW